MKHTATAEQQMKQNTRACEAGLIQEALKVATTPQDATTMKPPQTPAHAYLPPEHQAILRTLARWLGDDAGNLGQDSDQPSQTKQEEIGK